MIAFIWLDDIGVAQFMDACSERVYTSTGPRMGTRHLISPELAGNNVTTFLLRNMQSAC